MKRKVINISEAGYDKIKDFCKKNSFKISSWCEQSILEKVDRENKTQKKMSKL